MECLCLYRRLWRSALQLAFTDFAGYYVEDSLSSTQRQMEFSRGGQLRPIYPGYQGCVMENCSFACDTAEGIYLWPLSNYNSHAFRSSSTFCKWYEVWEDPYWIDTSVRCLGRRPGRRIGHHLQSCQPSQAILYASISFDLLYDIIPQPTIIAGAQPRFCTGGSVVAGVKRGFGQSMAGEVALPLPAP